MDSEPDRLERWRARLREACEAAVPELHRIDDPAAAEVDPADACRRALELARAHARTARASGAEVVVRAVGVDAHGLAWATFWRIGRPPVTLCTSDDEATLTGLAALVADA